ncbi:single-stranded DNA-binding protein [Nakamurella leprariae]|uniref:Single-stranded DNA-binding protein n=1 Tax=Nakamurella leprariae TaxID=2803911 RepID=A0A938YG25_9ACTN|nr:single-stranded DNA-binding protein [Nakamurella leprariae]MBM9467165.1 single-stranded DNA-binding protein [Nakamurella leprariae]
MRTDAASVTIVGRAANQPALHGAGPSERVQFRVISTERRYDPGSGTWTDGDEYAVQVTCWRSLAGGVISTVRKGDPVVVLGRIVSRRYEKNGEPAWFTEVKADAVGLDVARLGGRMRRTDEQLRATDSMDSGAAGTGTGSGGPDADLRGVPVGDPPQDDDGPQPA